MSAPALPVRHLLLAVLVACIWGFNFVVIKLALRDLPPLLFCALRFILVAVPAVFFLPRPAVRWRELALYGSTMFAGHFGFVFVGMHLGVSAGLTSLVLQLQAFLTIGIAAVVLHERPSALQVGGAVIAATGLGLVAAHTGGDATFGGLTFVLLGAVSWAIANLTTRRMGKVNALALVVWGSLIVPLPLLAASLVFEGPALIAESLAGLSLTGIMSVAFVVYVSTLVGFSLWSWLLARHPVASIAPFTLLVPVAGLISSALVLGESLPGWKLQAAALVLTGLAVNVFGPRLLAAARSRPRPSVVVAAAGTTPCPATRA